MLSVIMSSPDTSEVLFLVALILFAIVAIIRFMAKDLVGGLMAVGAAILAFGFLAA
jgi:hypothetical protein